MKQAWNRLGSPDAISWYLVLLISVQVTMGGLAAPFVDLADGLGGFLLARLGSLAALILVLWVGKALLNRYARERARPLLTLGIFALATLALTVMMNFLLITLGFTREWNLPQRLIVAIPGSFAILVVSGVLVTYARELARTNSELAAAADELVLTRSATAERIEERKQSLVSSVQHELERAFRDLGPGASSVESAGLRSLIDDVVRPLSYQLASVVQAHQSRDIVVTNPRVSWSALFASTVHGNPIHPFSTALWSGVLLGTFIVPAYGLSGASALAAYLGITIGVGSILRLLWKMWPNTAGVAVRGVAVTSLFILSAIVSLPAMSVLSGYDFFTINFITGWITLIVFISWTVALMFAVAKNLQASNTELNKTVTELRREVVNLNNEYRLIQKRISRILHGPVQEAITASLIRQGTASSVDSGSLADVQRRITVAFEQLNLPVEASQQVQESLDDLVELWDEVVDIQLDVSPAIFTRIQRDPVSTYAFVELIREACGNAIRHGEAKHISVSASVSEADSALTLVVLNDGCPLSESPRIGLGSQMFDEMCLSWSRRQVGPQVRLEALIPISN